jgi:hypothetical protein
MPVRWLARRGTRLFVLYGLLIAAAIGLDGLLHALGLRWVGRWLGPLGTGLVVISFAYSLRKRGWLRVGSPRLLLRAHEALAWAGALALLVHAGVHFHALLPWLAVAAMLIAVASGLVGEFLLSGVRSRLAARERELRDSRLGEAEIERALWADALLARAMGTWRVFHLPIAVNFAVLALLHILTILLFT